MQSTEFSKNIRHDLQQIGYNVDGNFLGQRTVHKSNSSIKDGIITEILHDCKLMNILVLGTWTDYFYFDLCLPKFVHDMCREKCVGTDVCNALKHESG